MKKKYGKILIVAIVAFFASIIPAYAREMTLDELGTELRMAKWGSDHDSVADYAYLIGNYVFTSNHILKTQDIMLAARSIKPSDSGKVDTDSIYDEMSIIRLDYNGNTNKWEHQSIVGNDTIDEDSLNINYIDYEFIKELTKSNVDIFNNKSADSETYRQLIEDTYGFTGGNDANSEGLTFINNQLSGLLKRFEGELNPGTFGKEDLTGYYFSFFAEFAEKDKLTDKSTIKIRVKNGNGDVKSEKVFTKGKNFDSDAGIAVLFAYHPESEYKIIEIVLDVDGDDSIYGEAVYTIDLTNLRVPSTSKVIVTDEIPEADKTVFEDSYQYEIPTLEIDDNNFESSKEIIVKGELTKQDINNEVAKFGDSDLTGYYLLLNFNHPDFIPGKTTIKVSKGHNDVTKTIKDEIDSNGASILIALSTEATEDQKIITVLVDIDGSENEYTEEKYTINWKDLILVKETKVSVKGEFTDGDTTVDDVIKNNRHITWTKGEGYTVNLSGSGMIFVRGFLTLDKNISGLDEDKTGYYFPFVLELEENAKDETEVTVPCRNSETCPDGTRVIKGTDFDTDKGLLVFYVDNKEDKTFTVTVDLDGESNHEYAPTTIVFDLTNLSYQEESVGSTYSLAQASDGSIDGFDWNAIKESQLGSNSVLKQQTYKDKEGYYVPIKIAVPNNIKEANSKWTLTLESGSQSITPTETDYNNGYVIVVVEVTEGESEIKYSIDYDGTANNYLGVSETIKTNFEFRTQNKVTLSYLNGDGESVTKDVNVYEGEIISSDIIPGDIENPSYHELSGWYQDGAEFKFGEDTAVTTEDQDITLTAHYTIDGDEFLDAVVNNLKTVYTDKFNDITKSGNTITFDVKDNSVKLSELTSPKIPGIIEYALGKKEVLGITFDIDGQNDNFTLSDEKATISSKLQTLFQTALSDAYTDFALNNMALYDKTITITIGATSSTTELLNSNKVYTIKFTANSATVSSEADLTKALEKAVKYIYIAKDFNITSQHTLNRNVEISSLDGNTYTLTASSDINSIFDVKEANVTINNLKMTAAKQAIIVENASTLNATNLDLSGSTEAGILVNGGGNLVASKLTYSNEKYDIPVVKAVKKSAKVDLTIDGDQKSKANDVYRIKTYEDQGSPTGEDIYKGDQKILKEDYNYVHYFLDNQKADRWIKITYIGDRTLTSYPSNFIRYYDKESESEYAPEPPKNILYLTTFSSKVANYTIAKWSYWTESKEVSVETDKVPIPTGEISYFAQLKPEYLENVLKIKASEEGAEDKLIEAVNKESTTEVVIIEGTVTLTKGVLDIAKEGIIITGLDSGKINVNGEIVGQIKVTADDVKIEHLKITGNVDSASERNDVVTVNGHNFYVSTVNFNANAIDSEKTWDSLVHYSYDTPTTTIYFSNFDGANAKVLVEFTGTVNNKTRLSSNHYIGGEHTKEFVVLNNGISESEGSILELIQSSSNLASCSDGCYGLKIKASTNSSNVNVDLGTSWFDYKDKESILKILIEVTDEVYDVSNYKFKVHPTFKDRVKIYYKKGEDITEYNPKNDSGNEYDAVIESYDAVIG